ncbi:zinc finger BED domain-containing protein 5-like [Oratosquilla oratoria]|uniref:zinc finger BED domain-containing protein 5-like n=1 Tax=Oratosquilla oratoria TaxID=337810 RepID=UPI003F75F2F3
MLQQQTSGADSRDEIVTTHGSAGNTVRKIKVAQQRLRRKHCKPHTTGGSLIMPAVAIVLSTVMKQSPKEVTSIIPLNNSSVSRCIDEMAADVESQLVLKLQVNEFSLELDETTLPHNSVLLMAFARIFDGGIREEQIFALKFISDTKGDVISFLSETELGQKLVDAKSDILYLSDICEKLNVLNKELQGNDSTLFSCKEAITQLIGKLKLLWLNLGRREFGQFPSLVNISTELLDADLAVYVDHLKQLHNDMKTRFSDLLQMTVPDWFVDPFIADASEVDVTLQESVVELQNDTTARARFKRGGRHKLWMDQDVYEKYPLFWKEVRLLLLAFPTSNLVETGFSRVMHLMSKT